MKAVVISARGVRATDLGPYGNPWVATPALDRLAAQSVVFDAHFADRADSAGARRAWRTGRYDLPAPDAAVPLSESSDDFLALLRDKSVSSLLVLDDSRPDVAGFELDEAFPTGWDEVRRLGAGGKTPVLERAVAQTKKALRQLGSAGSWLLWIDLATTLPPWQVPDDFLQHYFAEEPTEETEESEQEEETEEEETFEPPEPILEPACGPIDTSDDQLFLSLQQSHAAAVSYLDAGVGELLDMIEARDDGDEIVVIFLSDCGLPLGEHGVVGTGDSRAHQERVHVPLLVRAPGLMPRRVSALTQAVDVAVTLTALFDATLPTAHGHDLGPLLRGEAEAVREYACCAVAAQEEIGWCLRTPTLALHVPARPGPGEHQRQLFIKPDDAWEVNNVIHHHLERAEALEKTLRDFVALAQGPGPLRPPTLPPEEVPPGASDS